MSAANPEPPRLFPTLRCRDAQAMAAWLNDVLGFTEHAVYRDNGVIQHAELAFGSSLLMIGQDRDDDYGRLVGGGEAAGRTDALYLAVDDADAVHARAKAAGARIERDLQDTSYGSREFMCRDPEGNLWSVGTYWPKVDRSASLS